MLFALSGVPASVICMTRVNIPQMEGNEADSNGYLGQKLLRLSSFRKAPES